MKAIAITAILTALTLLAPTANAQTPPVNVSKAHHPNLAAAQRLAKRAYEKILTAQQDNEFDLGGHAAKAKDLLDQANTELKAAAETANHN